MRIRQVLVALALLGVTALGATAVIRPSIGFAEDEAAKAKRTIDVVGRGKISIKYDTANISLGVSVLKPTADEAYGSMADSMAKVIGAVKEKGVKDDQLKTGTFGLQAEYTWVDKEGQKLTGYRATNTVTITTQVLDSAATLIQAAVSAGANQMNGITFSVKETDKVSNEAMDLAVDDARAKAERVAKRLGAVVSKVSRVTVNDAGGRISPMAPQFDSGKGAAGAAPAPVFSGSTDHEVTISVTFELE